MNVTNITDEYNDSSTTNITDKYNNTSSPKCTIIEYDFDIIIPALLLTIPCGLSFLCLMTLKVYTLIKTLLKNK